VSFRAGVTAWHCPLPRQQTADSNGSRPRPSPVPRAGGGIRRMADVSSSPGTAR